MSSNNRYLEYNYSTPRSRKTAEAADSDEDCTNTRDYRQWAISVAKRFLAYGLALLLLLLGFFFILFGGDTSRPGRSLMSRAWPRVSLFKAHIQRWLRSLWRETQPPKQYVR